MTASCHNIKIRDTPTVLLRRHQWRWRNQHFSDISFLRDPCFTSLKLDTSVTAKVSVGTSLCFQTSPVRSHSLYSMDTQKTSSLCSVGSQGPSLRSWPNANELLPSGSGTVLDSRSSVPRDDRSQQQWLLSTSHCVPHMLFSYPFPSRSVYTLLHHVSLMDPSPGPSLSTTSSVLSCLILGLGSAVST